MSPDVEPPVVREEWIAWKRSLDQAQAAKDKCATMQTMHGKKWTAKMVAHYTRVINGLLQSEPTKWEDG